MEEKHHLGLKITEEVRSALQEIATTEEINVSQVVRRALTKYIKSYININK